MESPARQVSLVPPPDRRQSETALAIARGTARMLRTLGFSCISELPLPSGRRADLVALNDKGEIWIVEIKSSLIDYRVDAKWPNYKDYCDRFFFAKPPELDAEIFPSGEGLIVADNHGAEVLRMAEEFPLAPARRKAMLLKLARLGADRVHALMDPLTGSDGS